MYTIAMMMAMSSAPETPQFNGFFRDLLHGCCSGSCNGSRASDRRGDGSCNGCCGGGLFNGGVRDFFAGVLGGRGCCGGGCNGTRPASRDPDYGYERYAVAPRPIDRGYDRGYISPPRALQPQYIAAPYYPSASCQGSMTYAGGIGSCIGNSCFGNSCNGSIAMPSYGDCFPSQPYGLPSQPMTGGGYAMPIEAGFSSLVPTMPQGCECGSSLGTIASPPIMDFNNGLSLPRLGTPIAPTGEYPPITNPQVPMNMPGGFAQPREAPSVGEERGSRKTPILPSVADRSRGTVQVKIPADAKLFVEGRQMTVKDGEKSFVTPPLPSEREAVYTFKIEFVRDGETIAQTRKVNVRAGATTNVEFQDLVANRTVPKADRMTVTAPALPESVKLEAERNLPDSLPTIPNTANITAQKETRIVPTVKPPAPMDHAKITVKLPEGATLYVNGAKNERSEAVRLFTTPTLTPGKSYQYVMKAEILRKGLPEYQEQKVDFTAGDNLTLDFTNLGETSKIDQTASK